MTPTLENLDQRVTVLEERMDQEAGLRASQDRDLSEMAATVKTNKDLLQALATTQSEHTQKLDRLDRQMGEMRGQMGEMLNGMGEMRGEVSEVRSGMGRVQDGMQQIVGMLDT
jgi:peptidoglycan hydrolase CwlO-like protein